MQALDEKQILGVAGLSVGEKSRRQDIYSKLLRPLEVTGILPVVEINGTIFASKISML